MLEENCIFTCSDYVEICSELKMRCAMTHQKFNRLWRWIPLTRKQGHAAMCHLLWFTISTGVLCWYQPAISQDFWQPTSGPSGGGVNALAINDSAHIFAGTSTNGVYLSTDSGGNWTQINTGLTNTDIRTLAINQSGHIFAGTSGGIFRSTNNGGNWTQINTGLTNTDIRTLAINQSGHIFAGTSGGIFRSTNNGENWTQIDTGLTNTHVRCLAIILSQGQGSGYIFAGTEWGGVFRSTDNGNTWTQTGLSTAWVYTLAISSSRHIFAGIYGGVHRSTDYGESWTQMNTGLTNTDVKALAINQSEKIFAGTYGIGGGVYRSSDNGANWTQINAGLTNTNVLSLAINSGGFIFAGTEGGIVFRSIESTIATPMPPTLVSPLDGSTGVSTNATLRWSTSTEATSYRLQVSTDSSFSNIVIDQAALTDTSYRVSGLLNNTTYYWRVNASNVASTSSWSSVWHFTTNLAAPTLLSPSNGATEVSVSPTLSWNPSAGATSYRLQVSTDSSFSNIVIDQIVVMATSSNVSGLAGNTMYYWRVNAIPQSGAAGTSDWSSVWHFTTSFAAPPVPTLASPPNGASGVSTSVTLIWNASSGAIWYRLQISTTPTFVTTVGDLSWISGTSHTVSGLSNNTTYFWRVSASNAGGASSWSSIWSFTTVVAAPQIPTLVSPPNGATGLPTSLTLKWNASAGATSYRLQVSTNPGFTSTVVDQSGIIETSYTVSGLLANTTYYWRVYAVNAGSASDWSSVWSFTVIVAAPTLIAPSNGEAGVSTNPTLSWNTVAGATSYRLQVSTSSTFATTVVDQSGITGTSYALSGLSNYTTYYWRVNATASGGTSDWSGVWIFTTILAAPILSAPPNAAVGVSTSPLLEWYASLGATSYRLQVSTISTFATVFNDIGWISSTSYAVSGLSNNTTYYWRVNATNAGGTSDWSSVWSFTTIISAPSAPTLLSPPDHWTGLAINPTLNWNLSSEATSYRLQVSTSPFFSTVVLDTGGLISGSYTLSGLSYNTTYYWRVNATNVGGTSDWSSVWSFTTIVEAPSPPPLGAPLNGEIGLPTNLTLSWNMSERATSYRIQVATNSTFTALVVDQGGLTGTSYTLSGLSYNTTYYWRVNATNAGGTSDWSSVWSFTTIVEAPQAPTLVSPLDGATDIPVSPTLTWNASAGATSYRVQISTTPSFNTTVVDSDRIKGTSFTAGRLLSKTIHYWRVNATNLGGTSAWSSIWSFTTIAVSSVEQISNIVPGEYHLSQNFPNPFNPTTTILFDLPQSVYVTLKIYTALGKEVAAVVSEYLSAGSYKVEWNANGLASGVYYYQMRAGGFVSTRRLVVLK